MKAALLAVAFVLVVGTHAHASWAENANKEYPVFTGTDQALARAQAGPYERHWTRRLYRQHRRFERR